MPDIIKLLPDSVANQIAAGEVIQRPASAVKELLENAIDAHADDIRLIIKDAGKTLIQVVDNGCGMSETDARMCFERHATSKIKTANDLFHIRSLGFRGEALASIAAVSQVELKTKRDGDSLATSIIIEGSELKEQGPASAPEGTSISVKNLFFNVPARRKFLKSDTVETRNIIEEFTKIAIVTPRIAFSLFFNNKQLLNLPKANARQRIINIFGNAYNQRLVPVEQKSDMLGISGFICKPEFARKTRGEQYLYVNGRFIRHAYLHHAIESAFHELIPSDAVPGYFLYLEIDPKDIDVNIHPTKTEVNFLNSQAVYALLRNAVKQSLGRFNITPTLDFDDKPIDIPYFPKSKEINIPGIRINPGYNPFSDSSEKNTGDESLANRPGSIEWEQIMHHTEELGITQSGDEATKPFLQPSGEETSGQEKNFESQNFIQFRGRYIFTPVKSGMMVIDQHLAHKRILFEKYMELLGSGRQSSQQELFPVVIPLSPQNFMTFEEIREDLLHLGLTAEDFGNHTVIVKGTPDNLPEPDVRTYIENVIEQYKQFTVDLKTDKRTGVAMAMASKTATRYGKVLKKEEMQSLVSRLFACNVPGTSPSGRRIISIFTEEELTQRFKA